MAELPLLPIEPSSRSLSSHIAAFNQLIAQLETITSRTRWQAQIPLNGKARVRGEVEHTNDVKVCLGAGWWVEMTAREAVDYLNRKKLALLEYHLQQREGATQPGAVQPPQETGRTGAPWPLPPAISFNPLFRHPVGEEQTGSASSSQASDAQASSTGRLAEAREENQAAIETAPTAPTQASIIATPKAPADPAPLVPHASSSPTLPAVSTSNGTVSTKSSVAQSVINAKQAHAPRRSSPLNPSSSSPSASPLPTSLPSAVPPTSTPAPSRTPTQGASPADKAKTAEALADLLRQIAETDKLDLSGAKEDSEPLVNEDGLPIHEIRETPDGAAIDGSLVTQANKTGASVSTEEDGDLETEMREKEKEYWSTAAVAKRKALFDRVFGGVSDSDEDEADELDAGDVGEDRAVSGTSGKSRRKGKGKARHDDSGESEDEEEERASFPLSIGARRSSSPPPIPNVDVTLPTPSSPTGASIAAGAAEDDSAASIGLGAPPGTAQSPTSSGRRTSASMPPPAKSILKPAQRKKSVSFDESVPIPPDSPDRTAGKGKMGFQLPLPIAVGDDAADHYGEKAVPTIHAPTPKNKADQGAAGGSAFAGFKRGFLNGPTSSPPSQAKSSATPSAAVTPSTSSDETKPTRKPSLFAQRMAQKAVVESPAVSPPIPPSVPEPKIKPKPALPKMSESTGTSSVKPAVVEKPPAVRETVKEAPQPEIANWTPLSQLPPNAPSGFKPGESSGLSRAGAGDNLDEDDEDDYEDHELEFDSDEEDEYDLDDALLAREMALEYHRRKMYQPRKYGSDEEDDAADDDAGAVGEDGKMDPDKLDLGGLGANGLGNVMLALPQVEGGDGPQIVNPTPDDWRRFVRVGRLENGNLVLAPGQEGWEEGDEEDGATAEAHADAGEHNGTEIIPAAQSSGSTLPPSTATANAKPGHQDESALSAEEKKANVERMKRVILGLEEDKPVKPATVSSPASQILLPPTLQKAIPDDEGASSAPPVAASARSNVAKAETKGLGDIVERSAMPAVLGVKENTGVAASDAAPPKKVSRFKAARLGA